MSDSYPPVILNEFQTYLYQRLDEFRQQNRLCDVNININGKLYPCHRIILTAASPFFESILNENQEPERNLENAVITLDKEIDTVALEEILNAIYTSRLNLLPSNVYFILKASHIMQLEVIKNACISWIMSNTDIYYLIDACLFAKNITEEKLYVECVDTIASDWIRWSRTDSFREIPFEVLNLILSKCNSNGNEEIMLLVIIKWSKYHNARSIEVQTLLDSAKLKGKIVSTPIMSELIINADGDLFANEKPKNAEKKTESNVFDFNLYLNAVNVKTGVKGWGVMKINETFSESIVSNFYVTKNLPCRKVVKVGMKLFCLEYYTSPRETNVFYCYDECNLRQELKLPTEIFPCFDMVAIGNTIYVLKKGVDNASIWSYDCVSDHWEMSFEKEHTAQRRKSAQFCYCSDFSDYGTNCAYCEIQYETYTEMKPALYNYKNISLAFTDPNSGASSSLYVIAKDDSDRILSFDSRSPGAITLTTVPFPHQNSAVCTYNDKIAVSGSNNDGGLSNSFNIFDITARQWLTNIKPMNYDRANHNLFYHKGFLYAVENGRPLVSNEKYDLKSNEWINIPSLPKRILVDDSNDVVVVSAADVFGAHVNSIE